MGQKLLVPAGVIILAVAAGISLYFIFFSGDAPRTNPDGPDIGNDGPPTVEPQPIEINPADFDPARMQPDPVRNDRPAQTFETPEESEHLIVSGYVLDETGLGIADARVTFIGEQGLRDYTGNAYTDATGFYRLVGWAPNPGGTMNTENFGRVVAETSSGGLGAIESTKVDATGEIQMPDVEIRTGATIEGQVLTADGEPVPGAQVTVRSSGVVEAITTRGRQPSLAKRQYVETVFADASGNYRLANLPRAEYRANAHGGYYGHNTGGEPIDLSNGGTHWYEIRMPDQPRIRGQVVDQYGSGVSGVVVQLIQTKDAEPSSDGNTANVVEIKRNDNIRRVDDVPRRFDSVQRLSGNRTVTDANGRFGFHATIGQEWALVTRVGESEARVEGVKPSESDYTLNITVETSIGGFVRDAETGRVVEKYDVRVLKGGGGEPTPFQKVSADGKFQLHPGGEYSIANPAVGRVFVRVSAPGYAPQQLEVASLQTGDQRRDLDVALTPLCEVTLELMHEGRKLDLVPVALLFEDRLAFASGTNELGLARIPGVTPTTYRVKAVLPDGSALEGDVTVPAQANADIEVELTPAS